MLLSDEEIDALWLPDGITKPQMIVRRAVVRAAEAAILSKLASAKLLPVQDLSDEEKQFIHCNPDTDDLVDFIQGHAAAYGQQAHAQGFAAGAAAQLSAEPSGFIDRYGEIFAEVEQMLSTDTPLYTRRESK